MVKLFLVEDEIIMRNGIKNIDWKAEDIELVGEASDGELAYPMILESKPDILLTDIKMPFMDGLELSERVKRELPELQIIILSGFDEFTYAQKAVSLGVTEYLLKPVTPAKLLEVVVNVKKKIEEERKQSEQFVDMVPQERREVQRQRFFRHLVMNTKTSSELLDMAEQVDINLSTKYFCVLLMYITVDGVSGSDFSIARNEFFEQLGEILKEHKGWTLIDRGENGFAMLVSHNHTESMQSSLSVTIASMEQLANEKENISYFISVGTSVNRVSEIKSSYEQATKASSYRFLMGPNQVIYAENLQEEGVNVNDTKMDFNDAVSNNDFREALEKFLRIGTSEEIHPLIQEMFVTIGEQNLRSKIFLTYLLMDMYLAMLRFAKEMDIETADIDEQCGDLHELLKRDFSPQQAQEYVETYLREIFVRRDSKKEKRYNSALRDALAYIDENYDKEDISLSKVASIANISPNHFSAIFSQEVGSTFVEYLINKRMDKAKELLMTTELRSSEVAYQVGYKDPHYFSHTFKKNLGMTPKEYRSRGERKE